MGTCDAKKVVYKGWGYPGATNQKETSSQAAVVQSEKMRQARMGESAPFQGEQESRVCNKKGERDSGRLEGNWRWWRGPNGGKDWAQGGALSFWTSDQNHGSLSWGKCPEGR